MNNSEYTYLIADLDDDAAALDTPYSMVRITLTPPEHADMDIALLKNGDVACCTPSPFPSPALDNRFTGFYEGRERGRFCLEWGDIDFSIEG